MYLGTEITTAASIQVSEMERCNQKPCQTLTVPNHDSHTLVRCLLLAVSPDQAVPQHVAVKHDGNMQCWCCPPRPNSSTEYSTTMLLQDYDAAVLQLKQVNDVLADAVSVNKPTIKVGVYPHTAVHVPAQAAALVPVMVEACQHS